MKSKYFLLILIISFIILSPLFVNSACTSCFGGICNDICEIGESSSCSDCYSVQCGDGYCEPGKSETCSSCSADCGKCDGDTCSTTNQCKGVHCASTDTNCLVGYCVHGYCRSSSIYCGDGYCDAGETCKSDSCCSGVNVNFNTDKNNCGDCSAQCETNKECVSGECQLIVTPTCAQGDGCKTGCPNGDIDCTCSQQSGDLCIGTEMCPNTGISLSHSATGICCSVTCTSQQTPYCTSECDIIGLTRCVASNTKLQNCTKRADNCNYWENQTCSTGYLCASVTGGYNCVQQSTSNPQCPTCSSDSQWSSCIYNQKSRTKYYCNSTSNNQCASYTEYTSCTTTQAPTPCTENLVCAPSFSECKEGIQIRECIDRCSGTSKIESKQCEQETIEAEKKATTQVDINQVIGNVTTNFFNNLANKLEEILKTSKYSLLILFILVTSIIVSIVYYIETNREKILRIKPKLKIKEGKKPVKINDLMVSVIDSLDTDEREICYALAENEGITQEELRNKVNLAKTKLEIALTKLERRQVIKKREGENPKLYFNDWLK